MARRAGDLARLARRAEAAVRAVAPTASAPLELASKKSSWPSVAAAATSAYAYVGSGDRGQRSQLLHRRDLRGRQRRERIRRRVDGRIRSPSRAASPPARPGAGTRSNAALLSDQRRRIPSVRVPTAAPTTTSSARGITSPNAACGAFVSGSPRIDEHTGRRAAGRARGGTERARSARLDPTAEEQERRREGSAAIITVSGKQRHPTRANGST